MPTAIDSGRAPLGGNATLRDLGGHRTRVGQAVRRGVVFGAGALDTLLETDRALLAAHGVDVAFDLRTDHERREGPTAAPHLRTIHVELLPPSPGDAGPAGRAGYYERLLVGASGSIGSLLLAIAYGTGAPSVIHCCDGVDRTGLVGAVLLLAVEVDESVVLDEHELAAQPDGASVRAALAIALAALRRRYGTVEQYLVFAAGMTTDDLLALRRRMRSV